MATNQTTSPVAPSLNEIRDLKPPVEITSAWEWLWWALAGLVLAAALYALWIWRQRQKAQVPVEPPVLAHVRAKQKLAEALTLIAQPKPFVIAVSDATRHYLEERFEFHAPERTTEEFLHELQRTDLLTRDQKDSLGDFLQRCDLVKFAKHEPREPELRDLHGSAVRLVEETEAVSAAESSSSEFAPNEMTSIRSGATANQNIQTQNTGMSKGRTLAVVGTVLQLAPCIWVATYFITLFRLFRLVGAPQPINLGRPFDAWSTAMSEMNSILGDALVLLLVGLGLGVIGLVLIIIALASSRYRAEWFFWFLIVYGMFLVATFPIGTAVGIFFIVYCLTKRREFLNRQQATS